MNRPLLAKLTRPEPALALPRPRLFEGLDEELSLVWVSGPAGAGKTTLVSSYVVNKKTRACGIKSMRATLIWLPSFTTSDSRFNRQHRATARLCPT